MRTALLALAGLVALAGTAAAEEARPERLRGIDATDLALVYGVGGFTPEYEPPAPGTYALPVIDTVSLVFFFMSLGTTTEK